MGDHRGPCGARRNRPSRLWGRAMVAAARRRTGRTLEAMEVAYLHGGLRLAGYACIAELHRLGLVRAMSGTLVAVSTSTSLPDRAPKLLIAVRNGLKQPHSWQTLRHDAHVLRAGAALGTRLIRRDWMLSAARQRRLRLLAIPGLLVAGWYLIQVVILAMDFTATTPSDTLTRNQAKATGAALCERPGGR
ncbi:TIGR04222 domain-containing membrane protein [Actinoplanes sp. NPDC049118]|uniref:TIGR04222 domain-containing membrane protein n=1 Tax=Actinoplanes sp. NPDC049118 TaxID=3155769 RepID=UPI0033F6A9EE